MPSDLPIVATIHHSIHDLRLSPYKGVLRSLYHRLWIQYVERSNLDRANAVVAVSTAAALEAKGVFGHRYIQVIHNGVDTGGLLLQPRTLPNKPFRLIYVGAWKVLKGANLFPEIMRKLGSDFELHCVGGTPENREKVNLPNNIKLHGRIDDRVRLISIMQEADALLFPSLSEGFGLVIAESQACGLPVIASDCSCMPEVVVNGETGILCSENDASAFADGVRKLANQNDLWRSMRLAAYSFAVRNFSMERQVADYAHLYRLLLGQYERAD
jgi:glycosyltransferase involved in cell wall biosynthesis